MTHTEPRVSFGLYQLEINSDSTPSASGLQSFSKVADLKTGNITPYPYITYEPNFWLLDGTYKFVPADETLVHVGMMSTIMSGADSNFTTAPVLTITFTQPHTSDGLVLHFSEHTDDWADSITVAYYDKDNVLICTNDYTPDSWEYAIDLDVVDFAKIIITFRSTNKPYRYLRVMGIDYGQLIYFTAEEIKTATVLEEVDMLSATMPANTFDLSIHLDTPDFSMISPAGYYSRLSQRQPFSVYELVGVTPIFIGRYFLDDWKNLSDTDSEFKCTDAIGAMGRIPFRGGLWLPAGIASQDLIEMIMNVAAFPYELASELYDIPVMGWIPAGTCRDALQKVAMAIGAYVDCSRSNLVKIYSSIALAGTEDSTPITDAEQGFAPSLEMKSLVTSVEITAHDYSAGSTSVQLYSGVKAVGQCEISFTQPAHTLVCTGATIIESGVNYAVLRVDEAGTVVLTGSDFVDSKQTFRASSGVVGSYIVPKVIPVSQNTLISSANGQAVADRMYAYCQERFLQKPTLFRPVVAVGDIVDSDTLSGAKLLGVVEKMETDLTGGFLAVTDITGLVH